MRNPTKVAFSLSAASASPKGATGFFAVPPPPSSPQRQRMRPSSPTSIQITARSALLYAEPNPSDNENEKDVFPKPRMQTDHQDEELRMDLEENDMMEFYEELGEFIVEGQDEPQRDDNELLSEDMSLLLDDDREEFLSLFEGIEEEPRAVVADEETARPILVDPPLYQVPSGKGGMSLLEQALLQGVVPISASVGSDCLPGDAGFDPLGLSSKDYIGRCKRLLQRSPDSTSAPDTESSRPSALILRDYREAEIRHGRLAMLAAIFWPLQEMFDRFLLDPDEFGGVLCRRTGSGWLFFPALMAVSVIYLGYLDFRSQRIKRNKLGEAFLPGDCFWDPLKLLEGAPDRMKRNMQERELWNGRMAMMAVLAFAWEEVTTQTPVIDIASNHLLFAPAYDIPSFREWLDMKFETPSPTFTYPNVGTVDFVETYRDASTPPVENVPITDVDPETLLEEFAKQ